MKAPRVVTLITFRKKLPALCPAKSSPNIIIAVGTSMYRKCKQHPSKSNRSFFPRDGLWGYLSKSKLATMVAIQALGKSKSKYTSQPDSIQNTDNGIHCGRNRLSKLVKRKAAIMNIIIARNAEAIRGCSHVELGK